MSEPIEDLAAKLGFAVHSRHGMHLVAPQHCSKIVDACRAGEVLIVGIEAFRLLDGSIVPVMDLIADCSSVAFLEWNTACTAAAAAAEKYFAHAALQSDLWFEFTLIPEDGTSRSD